MRADRLIQLLILLQERGRMSAAALASELEVSVRTIFRDLDALSVSGFPVYAEAGRNGGYELLGNFRTDLTGFKTEELLPLLVSGPAPPSEPWDWNRRRVTLCGSSRRPCRKLNG